MSEMKRKVPSLDLNDYLSKDDSVKQKFVHDLYNSFEEYGFVILKNHTISKEDLSNIYRVQEQLFSLPVEEKKKYFLNNGGQRGYTPFGTENAKGTTVKDLKEFWHTGRETWKNSNTDQYPRNVWVNSIPDMKTVFTKVYSELENVGDLVLEALEPSLGVKKGFFKSITDDGNTVLRMLHYPPIPDHVTKESLRSAAHQDICAITVLTSASQSGLELLDKDGKWLAIESDPGSLILNIGDMIQLVTNGQLKSTTHRVVNPDPTKNVSRYSIPLFIHPRNEVLLEPLEKFKNNGNKFEAITAGDYLNERLKEIGLKK